MKHMMSRLPMRQLQPPLRKQFKMSAPPLWLKPKQTSAQPPRKERTKDAAKR